MALQIILFASDIQLYEEKLLTNKVIIITDIDGALAGVFLVYYEGMLMYFAFVVRASAECESMVCVIPLFVSKP